MKKTVADPVAVCLAQCLKSKADERLATMNEAAGMLLAQFEKFTKKLFPREVPSKGSEESWFAHNKALSILDLKGIKAAKSEIRDVFRRWPNQIESRFVYLLLRWRGGEISDSEVFEELTRNTQSSSLQQYFLGLFNRERGALRAAHENFQLSLNAGKTESEAFLNDPMLATNTEPRIILNCEISGPRISASCILADNSTIVVGDMNGTIRVFSIIENNMIAEAKTSIGLVSCIAAHPVQGHFAVAGDGPNVEIWNSNPLKPIAVLKHGGSNSSSVAFDRLGDHLFAATQGYVRRWKAPSGEHCFDYLADGEAHAILSVIVILSRKTIVALRMDWSIVEWSIENPFILKSTKLEPLSEGGRLAAHIGRPQLACLPSEDALLISYGWETGLFSFESSAFTRICRGTGWVTGRTGELGASCTIKNVSLYDFTLNRHLLSLTAPNKGNQKTYYTNDLWHEAPSMSQNGALLCCSAWHRPWDLNSIVVWDVAALGECKELLKAPYPLIEPVSSAEFFQRAHVFRTTLKKARNFLEADDPSQSLALASVALNTDGFSNSGDARALRWLAGRKLLRDKLTSVTQRASLSFGSSFAYLPEASVFLTQSMCYDESLLWEFSPDRDGGYEWVHGNDCPITEIGRSLREEFGAFGTPRFVGFDPIHNALYLERCIFLSETKAKVSYAVSSGSEEALKKAIREGVVAMIRHSISPTQDSSLIGVPCCHFYEYYTSFTLLGEGSSHIIDRAFVPAQPVLLTVDESGFMTVWDGTSRRYRNLDTTIKNATLINVSITGSKWSVASSSVLAVGELRDFTQSWKLNVTYGASLASAVTRIQFSADEKLILVCIGNRDLPTNGNRLMLLDTATSETVWEWEGSYRDATLTIDSRFLVISKKEGFEYFELEWSYRKFEHSKDWQKMVCYVKSFMAGDISSLRRSTESYDFNTSKPASKVRQLLKLVGLGERSDAETGMLLRQAVAEGCDECDPIVFDDYETETGQAAFPFYWDQISYRDNHL